MEGRALLRHIEQHFPHNLHYTTSLHQQAAKHKPADQKKMNFVLTNKEEDPWTLETMKLAAREFEVPACTELLLVMPEIFHRDILKIKI